MKKKLTILLLFFFNCMLALSQGRYIKATTPCDNDLLKKTPGRWMPISKGYRANTSKQLEQEMLKRLDPIRQWIMNIYPSPMAFDAVNGISNADQAFASQLKIERTQDRFNNSAEGGIPTLYYEFGVKFCNYFCTSDNSQIIRGAGCETGTTISVVINTCDLFLQSKMEPDWEETMRIEGRRIKMLPVLIGKWKDYDQYSPESGSGIRLVLLHRDGTLPYIPVTRKQYLERSIKCVQILYDKVKRSYEKPEGFATMMSKKELDEQIKKTENIWDAYLKYYKDELEATTNAGLLDSPAIIRGGFVNIETQYPVFTTQAEGGRLVVTENPAYFRRDLPKYIPQLMIYSMENGENGPDPALNPYHLYYKDFPIEKLQAMIDK